METVNDILIRALELQNQGQLEQASVLFQQVLQFDPLNMHAFYSLGVLYLNSGRAEQAVIFTQTGVERLPGSALLHFVHGAVLQTLGKNDDALAHFDQAIALQPNYPEALINSGVLLRTMFRHKEALERFNAVLQLQPENQTALVNCGIILTEFKESSLAIQMFQRLLALSPDYRYGLGLLFHERMNICDWTDFDSVRQLVAEKTRQRNPVCKSMAFMAASDEASEHLLAAQMFAENYLPPASPPLWQGQRYRHDKIRIAYVSPDLREHPVGHLMAGIFEHHDKSRFELIAISLGVDDQSRLRARMLKVFDKFYDVKGMPARQIAQLMRELEVDVAIDLGGYTSDTRSEVFTHRPAPVHVNYLGYPGSMGSEHYDYILADRHIIPPEHQAFYSEKVVYLPDSYLPTDDSVAVAEHTPSRAECGLPETGVVFCSFNHAHKLSPPVFEVWMNLLKRVPGSVLWLMSRGDVAQANLRREATARGVDPDRLIFAGRVPRVEDHLARYRQADLFLDTHPYNAHTTAADALMVGLPVVTYMGNSFPSRVAGSLLNTMGVPELITHNLLDYEALAFRLASNPDELAALKQKIKQLKASSLLFNTAMFCRNLEAVYTAMWRQAQLGPVFDEL